MSTNGAVQMCESDVEELAPDEAWKIQAPSLAAWWEGWLSDELPAPSEVWQR